LVNYSDVLRAIGILAQSGPTMDAPMMAPNGTRFGGWLLNALDNDVGHGV
jgi:hypothetical protein